MASVQALSALAIDGMLPALGAIARDLHVGDPNRRQLVIGVYLLGMGLGALLPGAMADRFGRRPVLCVCLAFYGLPMLACALVTNFDTLVVLRFIQALGCSGLSVVPPAIIRDRFEGDRMARLQSVIAVIFMIVPMAAPTMGQLVMDLLGWRWIFGVMAILGILAFVWVWLRLPETLHPDHRQAIQPRIIAINMLAVLNTRGAIGYVIASALLIGGSWGYINIAQQLVAEHFGTGRLFPLVFGSLAVAMALANFINSRIVEHFGARRVSHAALLFYIACASIQVLLALNPAETLSQFAIVMAGSMGMCGFLVANFASIALQPFGRAAGSAASVQYFLRTVLGASFGALIGQTYNGTARPLALALLGAGGIGLLLVLFSERGVLFGRRQTQQ